LCRSQIEFALHSLFAIGFIHSVTRTLELETVILKITTVQF
jgi:hypothetical protein